MSDLENLIHHDRLPLADKERQRKEAESKVRRLREDMAFVFGTEEGRRVLRHIKMLCGFAISKVGGNPMVGMNVSEGTLYNASRENIYLELRTLVPARILKQVEFENLDEII